MSEKLAGLRVLITGGGRGIGRGIVERLVADGARVVIAQRSVPDNMEEFGDRVHPVRVNLADPSEHEAAIAESVAWLGGLDVLINNAGRMSHQELAELTLADWGHTVALNLTAPINLARLCLGHMAASGQARIVNIGSIEGLAANPGHVAYATSKAAVHGMTRAMAVDLGRFGISVNAIAPGWIDTELNAGYLGDAASGVDLTQLMRMHPVGRLGTAADVAAAAAFLVSPEAGFITGEVLTVDGGRTAKLPTPLRTE